MIKELGHAIARENDPAALIWRCLKLWAEKTHYPADGMALLQHEGVRRVAAWLEQMHALAMDPSYDRKDDDADDRGRRGPVHD